MSSLNESAIQEVLERFRSRFYGKYRGTVTDVDDPEKRARIKAKVPAVLGEQTSGWCVPCSPYAGDGVGLVFIPEVGAGVWIEFEGGDVSYPIWTGCYWRTGELPSECGPAIKTIKTKQHTIVLDDNQNSITITDPNQNTVKLDSSGIKLTRGASSVALSDSEVNINDGALEVM